MLGVQLRVYRDHASVTNHECGPSYGYNEYVGSADGVCRSIGMEAGDEQEHGNKIMSTTLRPAKRISKPW
jgi:hypothetical protein